MCDYGYEIKWQTSVEEWCGFAAVWLPTLLFEVCLLLSVWCQTKRSGSTWVSLKTEHVQCCSESLWGLFFRNLLDQNTLCEAICLKKASVWKPGLDVPIWAWGSGEFSYHSSGCRCSLALQIHVLVSDTFFRGFMHYLHCQMVKDFLLNVLHLLIQTSWSFRFCQGSMFESWLT